MHRLASHNHACNALCSHAFCYMMLKHAWIVLRLYFVCCTGSCKTRLDLARLNRRTVSYSDGRVNQN